MQKAKAMAKAINAAIGIHVEPEVKALLTV
jgi:hypothetical protein